MTEKLHGREPRFYKLTRICNELSPNLFLWLKTARNGDRNSWSSSHILTETHSGCSDHVNNTHNHNVLINNDSFLFILSQFCFHPLLSFLPRPWAVELSGSKNPALITKARCSPLLAPANVHNNSLHKAATLLLGCTMRLHVLLCFSWACSVSEKKTQQQICLFYPMLMSCVILKARAPTSNPHATHIHTPYPRLL